MGFLWFNAAPARIIMGDVGALGIGAALALLALTMDTQLLLLLICGLNVMEAGSVALQMAVFKASGRKRRLFRMSPIHHHFELARLARDDGAHPLLADRRDVRRRRTRAVHRRLHEDQLAMSERYLVYGLAVAGAAVGARVDRAWVHVVAADDTGTEAVRARWPTSSASNWPSPPIPTSSTALVERCDVVVPAPGVPETHALFEIAGRARASRSQRARAGLPMGAGAAGGPRPMLAVTGTDGKTTVTLWATEMLRAGGARRWPRATPTCPWSPRSTSTSMRSSSSARASGWRGPSSSAARPPCGSTSRRITSTGTPRWRRTRRPRPGCSRSNGPPTRRSARPPIPS